MLSNTQVPTAEVAPYVGAWIETIRHTFPNWRHMSHPTWVRGLKLTEHQYDVLKTLVAPYVGAWIETPRWVTIFYTVGRTLRGCVD